MSVFNNSNSLRGRVRQVGGRLRTLKRGCGALVLATLLGLLPMAAGPHSLLHGQASQMTFIELHHVTAEDVLQFLRDTPRLAEYVKNGSVRTLSGKPKSILMDLPTAQGVELLQTIRSFENLEIRDRVRMRPLRINYASVQMILESLSASGVCQVWHRTEETMTDTTKQGNRTITHTYKNNVYSQFNAAKGNVALTKSLPNIPYVIEIPHVDPIDIPPVNLGTGYSQDTFSLDFPQPPSTEERNRILVVGTEKDHARIVEYIAELDKPARQIMIEVQIIELNANSLKDLGIDLAAGGQRQNSVTFASPLPGDPLPSASDAFAPIEQAGLAFLFDDQRVRESGKFMAGVHALLRNGEAVIKARPKLYTLDDRQNVLHVGEEVPTFESTGVNRDVSGGNFVEEVNRITKQYVGITVNIRPRLSNPDGSEVSMLVDIQINNIVGRDRVFEQDLLGVPTIAVRSFRGQARIRNHRPLILGGLIRESESSVVTKIPLLGDLPLIGEFMGRTTKSRERTEIILVLTPHVISERGVDPVASPKESMHFDTFNSVLFNDRYIMKGRDLVGLDPISRSPVESFTPEQVVTLTLFNIVRHRELVTKLKIFDEYLPTESMRLSLYKRNFPERSARFWPKEEKQIFYQAAAIVVENIKTLNPDLDYDELVEPRREIVLPTSPYHVSLSYEKLKPFYEKGGEVLMRDGGLALSNKTVELLRELKTRDLREFADFMKMLGRKVKHHGRLHSELVKYHRSLFPDSSPVEDLPYPQLYEALARDGMDFLGLATYLKYRLESQYRLNPPKLGIFEEDLALFQKKNMSLSELAIKLQQLDEQWRELNSSSSRPVSGL